MLYWQIFDQSLLEIDFVEITLVIFKQTKNLKKKKKSHVKFLIMSNWKCLNKFKIFLNRATTEIEKVRVNILKENFTLIHEI